MPGQCFSVAAMDVMKEWINPLVQTALRNCLESVAESSSPPRKPDWISGPIKDDDSNFRIPVHCPKCVQIVKVCSLCLLFTPECLLTLDNCGYL